jgi:RNA polymerase sigma-70 factor (ECF subfamily)
VDWEKIDREYESFALNEEYTEKYNPERCFSSQIIGPEVERALRGLPEEFRAAILLVDLQELNYEEAAKVMECPVGTVRSRLSRGRRLLQVALRNYACQQGLIKK